MLTKISNNKKYLAIGAIALVVIIYSSVLLISKYLINTQAIKQLLIQQVESKLQRKLNLADDISFSISWDFAPNIELKNITLSNMPNSRQTQMLHVASLKIKFNLLELLFKQVHINSITLFKPILYLETIQGVNNWDFNLDTNSNADNTAINLHIRDISIIDGVVSYTDHINQIQTLAISKLDLNANASNSMFNGTLHGTLNNIPLQFSANASLVSKEWLFNLTKLQINNSSIDGKLLVKMENKQVTGEFNVSKLNSADFASSNQHNSKSNGEYSVPSIELPVEQLKHLDLNLRLNIKALTMANLAINDLKIVAITKNNILNIKLDPQANIANGNLNLNLNYNLTPRNPSLELTIKTSQLNLEMLLKTILGKSPITGSNLELQANFKSRGSNLAELVNNLDGKILTTAGPGQYLNASSKLGNLFSDILGAMFTIDKRQASTAFTCAVINLKVNNGIASANNGIALEASTVNVLGNGRLDLRNGRIDVSITPQNISKNPLDVAQFNLAQLIKISGTISKPTVNFDPMSLLTMNNPLTKNVLAKIAAGLPGELAAAAESIMTPSPNNNISPCKTALER